MSIHSLLTSCEYFNHLSPIAVNRRSYWYHYYNKHGVFNLLSVSVPIKIGDLLWSSTVYDSVEYQTDHTDLKETPLWFQELYTKCSSEKKRIDSIRRLL